MDYSIEILGKVYMCKSVAAARDLWNQKREALGFGSSRQCGSIIFKNGDPVVRVSYNGRLWHPATGAEITIRRRLTPYNAGDLK